MSNTVTLLQLREQSRLYADHRPGGADSFITDLEYNSLINNAIREIYDRLIAAGGHHYYFKESLITLTSVDTPLPADFLFLIRWDILWGPRDIETIRDFSSMEEPDLENFNYWGRFAPKGFQIQGTSLRVQPPPTGGAKTKLQYVPTFTDLVADIDTFDGVNGWHKAVTLKVAAEARMIAEDEYRGLLENFASQMKRIDEMAERRAMYEPKRVLDVVPEGYVAELRRSPRLGNLPRN